MKKVALKNVFKAYNSSNRPSPACCYIDVFAVVVREKERGRGFIGLSGVHGCLQFLPLTNVSDLIYIGVFLLHFCASFCSLCVSAGADEKNMY